MVAPTWSTSKLRLHKEHERIPEIDGDDLAVLEESIATNGIRVPLHVTKKGVVLDGRHRLQIAKSLGLKTVPVQVVSPESEVLYMYDMALEHRHLEPGVRMALNCERESWRDLHAKTAARAAERKGGRPRKKQGQPVASVSKDERKTDHVTGQRIGVSRETVRQARYLWEEKKARRLPDKQWQAIKAGKVALKKVYLGHRKKLERNENGWSPRSFNIWPAFPIEDFQRKYPGQLPAELLRNVLHYTTSKGDKVVDVFGGGGNVGLVCKEMGRRCLSYDIEPKFPGIKKHNAQKPLPKEAAGAQLVFLDPPYWSQKKGEYSEDQDDLVNLGLAEFHDALAAIITNAAEVVAVGGFVVLIIGATQKDGRYCNHAMELLGGYRFDSLRVRNIVAAAYPPSQYAPPALARARDRKEMLNLHTNIVFWERAV